MTSTNSPQILSSLLREAGRQAEYYHSRGQDQLAQWWGELESEVVIAKRTGAHLIIGTQSTSLPLPIKGGEQVQQRANTFNPKVL